MKKTILSFVMVATILSSCNNNKKEHQATEQNTEIKVETQSHNEHKEHVSNSGLSNDWMKDMQLDNGNKWTANVETNDGVLKMKDILKSMPTNSIKDYHNLAAELTKAKNYVIKECTMKGPSHDYLHVWLLPLMEKIDALTETNDLDKAAKITVSIEENVSAYSMYFK